MTSLQIYYILFSTYCCVHEVSINGVLDLLKLYSDRGSLKTESESESYVTTDGQSPSLSLNKAPIWGLRPDYYCCQTVVGLLMWGVLSDETTGLSFTFSAGPRQRSHSRVRVPWCSWRYFTVSDSRLSFSLPRTTRRTTVEVFDPASTRDFKDWNYSEWYNNSVRTSQESLGSATKTSRLMLFRETVAAYWENHTNSLCGQKFWYSDVLNQVVHIVTTGL
jgi:hypothetical protein